MMIKTMAGLEPATSTSPNIGEWRSTIDLHGRWMSCPFSLLSSEGGVAICLSVPFIWPGVSDKAQVLILKVLILPWL